MTRPLRSQGEERMHIYSLYQGQPTPQTQRSLFLSVSAAFGISAEFREKKAEGRPRLFSVTLRVGSDHRVWRKTHIHTLGCMHARGARREALGADSDSLAFPMSPALREKRNYIRECTRPNVNS